MHSYNEWINNIFESIKKGLPGEQAQFKMAPVSRLKKEHYLNDLKIIPKESAVMALIFPLNNHPHLLLTERSEKLSSHSNQISFPGGKFDVEDELLLNTAFRELEEEVGVNRENVNVISPLTDLYIPVSNFKVKPFLAYTDLEPDFKVNTVEVKSIMPLAFDKLISAEIIKFQKMNLSYDFNANVPYFDVCNKVVWGATAMILSEIREILFEKKL